MPLQLFDLSEIEDFSLFQNLILPTTHLLLSFQKQFHWVFLSNITHIFLCLLWYTFLSSSELPFRGLFPSCDLTMIVY